MQTKRWLQYTVNACQREPGLDNESLSLQPGANFFSLTKFQDVDRGLNLSFAENVTIWRGLLANTYYYLKHNMIYLMIVLHRKFSTPLRFFSWAFDHYFFRFFFKKALFRRFKLNISKSNFNSYVPILITNKLVKTDFNIYFYIFHDRS